MYIILYNIMYNNVYNVFIILIVVSKLYSRKYLVSKSTFVLFTKQNRSNNNSGKCYLASNSKIM